MDYLSWRAGILIPRGNKVFSFAHRTFQEYLAACHLTDDDFPGKLARLARSEPNRWREVALLAAAKAARGGAFALWALVDELSSGEPVNVKSNPEEAWGAHLAAQAIVEIADLSKVSDTNQKKLARIKRCLEHILTITGFPTMERATAGVNMAHLGDERPGVAATGGMEFCLVPGGTFWMGDDESDAKVRKNDTIAYDFRISRYPVTQAQFREFVRDGGYDDESYWKEAKGAGVWAAGEIRGRFDKASRKAPYQFGMPITLPNHPVVGITWYESLAFTRWLTEKWRGQNILPKGWEVRLPSEVEWEKAARGGMEIPDVPQMAPIEDINKHISFTMKENEAPQRVYPWGNDTNPNRANYVETGIGATSAVGCFPEGASPYRCEEMAGNVWEWTRSIYKDYPYNPEGGRENLDALSDSARVVRGGAFYDGHRNMRCSCRDRDNPDNRYDGIGFRVMLSPFISVL